MKSQIPPTFWPSLVLRSCIAAMLAGLYALLIASRLQPAGLKARIARNAAWWGLCGLAAALPALYWYWKRIPPGITRAATQSLPTPMAGLQLSYGFAAAIAILLVLFGWILTLSLHFAAMNFVLGGILLVLTGRIDRSGENPALRRFITLFPSAMAATVTLGIAPLLFLQLAYPLQVYPAAIVSGELPYLVIAELVHKDQNSNYSGPDEKKIFIPFEAIARDFPLPRAIQGRYELSNMILQPRNEELGEAAELQVRKILAKEKGFDFLDEDALPIWNTVKQAKLIYKLFASLKVFLGAMAVVTLILGGVGVMNIMLLSVGERTHEIGICKAVGATTRRILMQFFAESMALTFIAGLAGVFLGWRLCALVNQMPKLDFFAGMIVTPGIGVIAFGFLTLVGVLASIYPAFMASLVDPIEALRYE